jgi:polysaccharide pyruvyl transferase WcaK-like protein
VAIAPRIATWGTFDVANFGDLLFPRIFEHEIKRRLPQALVRSFSPLGYLHPVPLDGGFVAEPLGAWTTERAAELARDLDFVAIGGGEIIHDHGAYYGVWYDVDASEAELLRPSRFFVEGLGEAERATPVAWHSVGIPFDLEGEFADRIRAACSRRPYLSVRDEYSRSRLVRAGVEREIAVVPDSVLLLDRLFSREVLERRLGYLRSIGAFPAGRPPLVVQGSRVLLPYADEIGRSLAHVLGERDIPVLLLEIGPCHGDGEFADAIAPYLPNGSVFRLPQAFVVEDLVAAIAHSRGVVGSSLHGSITAFAFGIPFSIVNLAGFTKLSAFAEMAGAEATFVESPTDLGRSVARVLAGERARSDIRPLVDRVDTHFDHLADLALAAAVRRQDAESPAASSSRDLLRSALDDAELRYESLRTAYDARGRSLLRERVRLMSLVENHERSNGLQHMQDELARAQASLVVAHRESEGLRTELARAEEAYRAAERTLALMRETRVFRYSAPFRRVWARIRAAVSE